MRWKKVANATNTPSSAEKCVCGGGFFQMALDRAHTRMVVELGLGLRVGWSSPGKEGKGSAAFNRFLVFFLDELALVLAGRAQCWPVRPGPGNSKRRSSWQGRGKQRPRHPLPGGAPCRKRSNPRLSTARPGDVDWHSDRKHQPISTHYGDYVEYVT